MSEYLIYFKRVVQIGPDDFEVTQPSLKVTHETTIGDIEEWYRKMITTGPMSELHVTQLETIKKD